MASLGCSALPTFLKGWAFKVTGWVGGGSPSTIAFQVGGCQPCCSRRCAAWMAEWRLGVADEGCWSCNTKLRVSCGACCAKTGKVSAQEAQ